MRPVSRDERNEYFGITLERAAKILDALNVRLRTQLACCRRPRIEGSGHWVRPFCHHDVAHYSFSRWTTIL
jgi:hypothetical protein